MFAMIQIKIIIITITTIIIINIFIIIVRKITMITGIMFFIITYIFKDIVRYAEISVFNFPPCVK